MVSLLATLGIYGFILVSTVALPSYRLPVTSEPNLADRSTPIVTGNLNIVTLADLQRNFSLTAPNATRNQAPFWEIECGRDTIPPGWSAPPEYHSIGDLVDCGRAIFKVTRDGGDPLEYQTWTSPAEWSSDSCGVFMAPGSRSHPHVRFARINISAIAHAIMRRCWNIDHGIEGGWAAIGGSFIVLLTGTEPSATYV